MADAVLRIQVAGLSDVPDGESRNDGVSGSKVTLTSVGVGNTTHLIRFANTSEDPTPPTLTQNTTTEWEFTPSAGAGHTYLIELYVTDAFGGEDTVRRPYRIPTANLGLLLPGPMEAADAAASLFNNGAAIIKASNDNASGNYVGWAIHGTDWFNHIESLSSQLPLYDRAGDPASVAGRGYLYVKDTSGVSQLFYEDDTGGVTQLTPADASATTTTTFTINSDATAAVQESPCLIMIGGDGVAPTSDDLVRTHICQDSVSEFVETYMERNRNGGGYAAIATNFQLGENGSIADLDPVLQFNAGTGAGAVTGNITMNGTDDVLYLNATKVDASGGFFDAFGVTGGNWFVPDGLSAGDNADGAVNISTADAPGETNTLWEFRIWSQNDGAGNAWLQFSEATSAFTFPGVRVDLGTRGGGDDTNDPVLRFNANNGNFATLQHIGTSDAFTIVSTYATHEHPGQTQTTTFGFSTTADDDGTAIGFSADAGQNSVAIGSGASAGGIGAAASQNVAVGALASAGSTSINSCVAVGYNATAIRSGSVAVGRNAQAGTSGSGLNVVIGADASVAAGTDSIVIIGNAASATTDSVAIGQGVDISARTFTVAIGSGASSGGTQGVAVGYSAVGNNNAVAVGRSASCTDARSIALGSIASAQGDGSMAIGYNSTATGANSVAFGRLATNSVANTVAIGSDSINLTTIYLGAGVSVGSPPNAFLRCTGKTTTGAAAPNLTIMGSNHTGTASTDFGGPLVLRGGATGAGGAATGGIVRIETAPVNSYLNRFQVEADSYTVTIGEGIAAGDDIDSALQWVCADAAGASNSRFVGRMEFISEDTAGGLTRWELGYEDDTTYEGAALHIGREGSTASGVIAAIQINGADGTNALPTILAVSTATADTLLTGPSVSGSKMVINGFDVIEYQDPIGMITDNSYFQSNILARTSSDQDLGEWFQISTVQTTSGGPTQTVESFTLDDNTVYLIESHISGRDQTSGEGAGYVIRAVYKRVSAGAPTLVGSIQKILESEDDSTWDATFDVSSNDVRVRVTGDGTNNTNFTAWTRYVKMASTL